MRRFLVLLILAMLVFWAVRSTRPRPLRHAPTREALIEVRRAVEEARHEVRQAWREARAEIHQAWNEASHKVSQPDHEGLVCDGQPGSMPMPAHVAVAAREPAEGLPVPIVPGTRVTEAEPRPPAPPIPPVPPRPPVMVISHDPAPRSQPVAPRPPATAQTRTIEGQISATEERARNDARRALRESVLQWLNPEVPGSWTPPARLLEAMIRDTRTKAIVKESGPLKDLGPWYVAELSADFSPQRRATFVELYNRDLVRHRLTTLGAVLAFVLTCLAALSGYIRADEATKGYYTNRLRMLAAA